MGFYEEAFQRNIGVFSKEEQTKLKNMKVAIAGCGGMGSQSAEQFARLGVENFSVADFDVYNVVNINNQFNCITETIGRNKAVVTAERIMSINPNAKVDVFTDGVVSGNVDSFIEGSNIVVDAIDYNSQSDSVILHKAARERDLYVYAPQAIGYGASVLTFDPKGLTLEEYIGETSVATSKISAVKFSPYIPSYADPAVVKSIEERSGEYLPNIASAQCLGISMLTAESLGFELREVKPTCVPKVFMIDLWDKKILS